MSQAEVILPEDLVQEEIPILDLAPFLAGEDGALERLANELRHAQENVGFYFIVNHGVAPELIARTQKNLRRFFALPDATKRAMPNYVPPGSTIYVSSTVNENTKPDLNEMLRIVRERPANHPAILAGLKSHGPNHWPDEDLLPGWRAEMLEYYETMENLGRRMLPLYARRAGHARRSFRRPVRRSGLDDPQPALPGRRRRRTTSSASRPIATTGS